MPINHVVVVNLARFKEVVDTLDGVTIDVPKPILSNKFKCPFSTQAECDRWPGYRFRRGEQTMDGQRALIYARVRANKLDPADNDITRGERQQAVVQAITDEVTSFGTFLRMPFIGDELVAPLATDLSANQLLQLALGEAPDAVERDPPLPARRHDRKPRRSVVHHRQRGQCLRGRHGGGQDCAAASAAGHEHVRPRLSGRPGRLSQRPAGASELASESAAFDSDGFGAALSAFVVARVAGAVAVLRGRAAVSPPVVRRVETRALEVDRGGVEHLRHRPLAADLADRRRRIGHALEQLEGVAVGTAIFVNWHRRKAALCRGRC